MGLHALQIQEEHYRFSSIQQVVVDVEPILRQETHIPKGPHAICFRIPSADVKPPPGIDVLLMTKVVLRLDFKRHSVNLKRVKSVKCVSAKPDISHRNIVPQFNNEMSLDDDMLFLDHCEVNIDSGYSSFSSENKEDEDMLMDEEIHVDNNDETEECMLFDSKHISPLAVITDSCINFRYTGVPGDSLHVTSSAPSERLFQAKFECVNNDSNRVIDQHEPYDYDEWHEDEDEDMSSTFDPLECDISLEFMSQILNGLPLDTGSQTEGHTSHVQRAHDENSLPRKKRTLSKASKGDVSVDNAGSLSQTLLANLGVAALKVAILRKPGQFHHGIKLATITMPKKLEEIAPVIWMPGFQDASASRAALMPTIDHALFKSFRSYARSDKLKQAYEGITGNQEIALWDTVRRGLEGQEKLYSQMSRRKERKPQDRRG